MTIHVIPILWALLAIGFCAAMWRPMREMTALVDHSSYVWPNGQKHTKRRYAKRCTVCNPRPKG